MAPTPAFTSAVGRPTPAPGPSRVPPPPVASSNGVYVGEDTTARAAIDNLLRQLVEQSGSDLHLRCGEPPILRRHGEMMRLGEQAPMDDGTLSRMLHVIMPERNRTEYAETNDSDFAYEIPGLARFRANAFRERKGPAAVLRVIPAKVVSTEELGISSEVQALCQLTKGLVLGNTYDAGPVCANLRVVDVLDERIGVGNVHMTWIVIPHRTNSVPTEAINVIFVHPHFEVVDDDGADAGNKTAKENRPRAVFFEPGFSAVDVADGNRQPAPVFSRPLAQPFFFDLSAEIIKRQSAEN
jgi:hypothetical protein